MMPNIGGGPRALTEDSRFAALPYAIPRYPGRNQKALPKAHLGRFGIALTATNEDLQVNVMEDADPRMIAVNAAGDPTMGSHVADLNSDHEIDPDRVARMQTFWRVIRPRDG